MKAEEIRELAYNDAYRGAPEDGGMVVSAISGAELRFLRGFLAGLEATTEFTDYDQLEALIAEARKAAGKP